MANRLRIEKIIYAKRVDVTKDQVIQILNLEIETHLRNNPDLCFIAIGEMKKNADRSQTYPILFELKSKVLI